MARPTGTGDEKSPSRIRVLPASLCAVLAVLAAMAACGSSDPAPGGGETATPAGEVGAPGSMTDVAISAEDSVTFHETMAWAREARLDTLPLGETIAALGRRFVGAPYVPGSLDPPGPERLVVNLQSFDCVTYLETMLAMARVLRAGEPSLDAFVRELDTIRYRTGVGAGYPSRLHYFSDWIATNEERGIVTNLTEELGGVRDEEPINFMTLHPEAYRQLADSTLLGEIRGIEERLSARPHWAIPQERIGEVADRIRNGDIIAAASTAPGLDIAHTGLALWVDGELHLMHAPLVGSSVEISRLPLAERILDIEAQDGIMVARPR